MSSLNWNVRKHKLPWQMPKPLQGLLELWPGVHWQQMRKSVWHHCRGSRIGPKNGTTRLDEDVWDRSLSTVHRDSLHNNNNKAAKYCPLYFYFNDDEDLALFICLFHYFLIWQTEKVLTWLLSLFYMFVLHFFHVYVYFNKQLDLQLQQQWLYNGKKKKEKTAVQFQSLKLRIF